MVISFSFSVCSVQYEVSYGYFRLFATGHVHTRSVEASPSLLLGFPHLNVCTCSVKGVSLTVSHGCKILKMAKMTC